MSVELLARRRALMGKRGLPYDAELDFLESTGVQYIDTGIVPDADTGFRTYVEAVDNKDSYIMGLRETTGQTRWCFGHNQDSWYWGYGTYQSNNTSRLRFAVGCYAELNWMNSGEFSASYNNNTKVATLPTLSFTPTSTIRLFGSSGVVATYNSWAGKIFYVRISQGNDIIMDLIPVRVGQVGYMYDKVSGRLFGNVGSGDFILGNDI